MDSFKTFTHADGIDSLETLSVWPGQNGAIFVCTEKGCSPLKTIDFRSSTKADGLPTNNIRDMCQTADGAKWVAGIDSGLAVSTVADSSRISPPDFQRKPKYQHAGVLGRQSALGRQTRRSFAN